MRLINAICSLILIISSCTYRSNESFTLERKANDTIEVFHILFDSTLVGYDSSNGESFRNNPYGDSIIIQFDSLFLKRIPSHDSLKFKILTEDEICDWATKFNEENKLFPNFLVLKHFYPTTTGYEVSLGITCVHSNYKNGKRETDPRTGGLSDTSKCHIGYLCGRSFQMSFERTAKGLKGRMTGNIHDG
jgi:hypothetical protein